MNVNRQALALAAALAATVLTGGAAILGLAHRSAPAATPVVVMQQPQQPAQSWNDGGD